jgi:hypothetical protein
MDRKFIAEKFCIRFRILPYFPKRMGFRTRTRTHARTRTHRHRQTHTHTPTHTATAQSTMFLKLNFKMCKPVYIYD